MGVSHLFDNRDRSDSALMRLDETMFEFLDRVDRSGFGRVRAMLNEWFVRWPEAGRDDLVGRLRAKDAAQFPGAFWELYLHEVHHRLGFRVHREPDMPGTERRPDFLVERGGSSFYLEATVVGESADIVARARQERALIDLVSQAYHPDFSVMVRGVAPAPQPVARRVVVRAVEHWLGSLNWDDARKRADVGRLDVQHIEAGGAHLFLRPWPRSPEARGDRSFPTVVTKTGRSGTFDEPPAILDDLRDKASRYRELDRPYVIALLVLRDFSTEHDVEQALYGPEHVVFDLGPGGGAVGAPWMGREAAGLWQRGSEHRATRVSAVLGALHLMPWSVGRVGPTLWRNPWAASPLTTELPWQSVDGRNYALHEPSGSSPNERNGGFTVMSDS